LLEKGSQIKKAKKEESLSLMFEKKYRKRFGLALFLNIIQQLAGINAINSYSIIMFKEMFNE
jgi:hypothetical protein